MKPAIRLVVRPLARVIARILVVPLARLIEPFWKLRLTPVTTARIGHLAYNNYFYVAQKHLGQDEKCSGRLFFGAYPCNRQLFEMWRRIMPVWETRALTAFYMYCSDIPSKVPMFWVLPHDAGERYIVNPHELVTTCGGLLDFTPQEHEQGRALLKEMGLREGDWFVCFQNRDPSFHEQRIGVDPRGHRNTDIETFLEAAEMIAEMGGFAIRMGAVVSAPLPENLHPRIIDYATNHRSDFGDIYLLGNCRFFLASATGTAQIPSLFGIPIAMTNLVPMIPSPFGRNSLFIPKLLKDKETGALVKFETYFQIMGTVAQYKTFCRTAELAQTYENDHYTLIDNNSAEIVELCRDMFDFLEGKKPPQEASQLQDTFCRPHLVDLPDVADFGPRIAPRFSMKYSGLF